MNAMKFLILLLFVPILFACGASKKTTETAAPTAPETQTVQRPRQGQGGDFQARNQEMIEKLGLNAEQTEKYNAINRKYMGKMRAMRDSASGDRTQMREQFQALRADQEKELQGVLTVDQFKKYKELRAQQRRQGPPGGRRPDGQRGR